MSKGYTSIFDTIDLTASGLISRRKLSFGNSWNGSASRSPKPLQLPTVTKPRGRPTLYTPELAVEICERLASGESLRGICQDEHIPPEATIRRWVMDDREGFAAHYTQARDLGLDTLADQVLDIADAGEDVIRDRLRFDARRWYLSKLAPKRYGERIHTELTGADGGPVQLDDNAAAARLAKLMAAAQRRKDEDEEPLV